MEDLQKEIVKFRDERNWKKFHTPKDLILAISSETGELADLFLWDRKPNKESIENEIADILIYILSLADVLNVDLQKAIKTKLNINARKYPVGRVYGKADKYK